MESEKHLLRIHKDIDRRNSTDLRIPPSMVIFVLAVFVCIAVYQGSQLSIDGTDSRLQSVGTFVTGTGVVISIMYLLTSRRYAHEDRDMKLMTDLMAYVSDMFVHYGIRETHYLTMMRSCIGAESGLRAFRIRFLISVAPAALGLIVLVFNATSEIVFSVTCALFAISLVINVIMLIQCITYPREHEKKFVTFSDAFVDSMARCGIRVKGYEPVIGFRPFWPFLILSIATFGIFFIYWLYRSMSDMDRHLEEQWVFENSVMMALKGF